MEAREMMHLLREAADCLGSYDEWPTLPAGNDPMPCLSRNRTTQPFYLAGEHDQVLLALAGRSQLLLPGSDTPRLELRLGEIVYIPAGQACRIVPDGEAVHLRYRPEPLRWEAAIWFCDRCGAEIQRHEFDNRQNLPQENYWTACQQFNADEDGRTCAVCSAVHPPCDLSDIRWPEVAVQIHANSAAALARQQQRRVPAAT